VNEKFPQKLTLHRTDSCFQKTPKGWVIKPPWTYEWKGLRFALIHRNDQHVLEDEKIERVDIILCRTIIDRKGQEIPIYRVKPHRHEWRKVKETKYWTRYACDWCNEGKTIYNWHEIDKAVKALATGKMNVDEFCKHFYDWEITAIKECYPQLEPLFWQLKAEKEIKQLIADWEKKDKDHARYIESLAPWLIKHIVQLGYKGLSRLLYKLDPYEGYFGSIREGFYAKNNLKFIVRYFKLRDYIKKKGGVKA